MILFYKEKKYLTKSIEYSFLKFAYHGKFQFNLNKEEIEVRELFRRQHVIQFSNSINNAEYSLWLSRYFIFANTSFYFSAVREVTFK